MVAEGGKGQLRGWGGRFRPLIGILQPWFSQADIRRFTFEVEVADVGLLQGKAFGHLGLKAGSVEGQSAAGRSFL